MSVYIHGMEMPNGCAECPFEMYYFNTGETRCRATNKTIETSYCPTSYEERDLDCPLVPVPEHGRLIDADALMAYFENIADIEWNKKAAPISWSYAFEDVMDDIENAPTIIPADERLYDSLKRGLEQAINGESKIVPVMEYPQVPGITPTVIAEEGEG